MHPIPILLMLAAAGAVPATSIGAAPPLERESSVYRAHRCGPVPPNWKARGSEFGELVLSNRLVVSQGQLRWNDSAVDWQTLRRYLREAGKLNPVPNLQVVIDSSTHCDRVTAVRRAVTAIFGCVTACVEYSTDEWLKTLPPWHR